MMKDMQISIIIPSYNQGDYIENTILSILKQTYQNWEIIIQDANSKDKTKDICLYYAKKDSRIKFYAEPDKGFADAVNKGLVKCTGTFVGIQSSDDFYASPYVFDEAIKIYNSYPALHLITGKSVRVDGKCRLLPFLPSNQENGFLQPETIFTLLNHFPQGATFFSLDRARQINGLNPEVDMVADTDFWVRIANSRPVKLNSIYRTTQVWACVTIHENQRSTTFHKFYRGRALMGLKHLKDENICLDKSVKFQNALNLCMAAFEYYCAIGEDTQEIQQIYRELTEKNLPIRKRVKALVCKSHAGRNFLFKDNASDSSMNFISTCQPAYSLNWFKQDR